MSNIQRRRPSRVIVRDVDRHQPSNVAGLSNSEQGHPSYGAQAAQFANLQAVLKPIPLLAFGVYFAYMVSGGSLQNYISPQHNWLAVLASALFLLVGLAGVLHYFRTLAGRTSAELRHDASPEPHKANDPHLVHHEHRDEHESHVRSEYHGYHGQHHSIHWSAFLVVIIPLLLGVFIPSKPLGAAALRGRAAPVEFVTGYTALPETDTSEWNMLQWQRAFNSRAKPPSWFEGQKASVLGFIVEESGLPAGHFLMGRWVMRHCAADAYGLGLLASGQGGDNLPAETWVRVKGSMGLMNIGGADALVLRAESIERIIGQPDPAYIFQFWNPAGSN